MKKLGIFHYEGEHGECMMFFTGKDFDTLIDVISCNDADWRHDYIDPILREIGVDVVRLDVDQDEADQILEEYFG